MQHKIHVKAGLHSTQLYILLLTVIVSETHVNDRRNLQSADISKVFVVIIFPENHTLNRPPPGVLQINQTINFIVSTFRRELVFVLHLTTAPNNIAV